MFETLVTEANLCYNKRVEKAFMDLPLRALGKAQKQLERIHYLD